MVATARGIFNSNGGVLSSIETGVSIIIPQGAIPDGVEQEIYFKVCRDNSILPPLDKEKGEEETGPGWRDGAQVHHLRVFWNSTNLCLCFQGRLCSVLW